MEKRFRNKIIIIIIIMMHACVCVCVGGGGGGWGLVGVCLWGVSCVCVWANVYVWICHSRDRMKIFLASKHKNSLES